MPPVFLMDGSTSAVTQCLNSFADGSLLLRMREYRPDSLMTIVSWTPVEHPPWIGACVLSSLLTWAAIAFLDLLYPNASATSLPTNHGSPEISTVLISPNCGWVNTVGASGKPQTKNEDKVSLKWLQNRNKIYIPCEGCHVSLLPYPKLYCIHIK